MNGGTDYVIVGSGSAGGTLADRLSETGADVVLIEAGPDFPDEEKRPPAFYVGGALHGAGGAGSGPPSPDMDWGYTSEPLPNGRRVRLSRGKLVGGSSMANGCVAVRAKPSDFSGWVAAGAEGWTWESVRPIFERIEADLSVNAYPRERWLPIQELFAEACQELGFRWLDDLNGPDAWDGVVGPWPRNRHNEVRQGTLNTYIRRARRRQNFSIRAHTLVDRVLIEHDRAVGVHCLACDGSSFDVRASHVVLSAGAYGSAPILLRSGVGPANELKALGIEVLVDLPVGRGLRDHPGVAMPVSVERPYARMGWPTLSTASRSSAYWGIPMTADGEAGVVALAFFLGLRDELDGRIGLASVDPTVPPVIDHGYWNLVQRGAFEPVWEDYQALLATSPFRAASAQDVLSGTSMEDRLLTMLSSGAHPAGGCGIGSVVDSDLAVMGVERLSVADASVFPLHVTNNPNLTVHVVGEVAARVLAGGSVAQRHAGSSCHPSESNDTHKLRTERKW
jgi:choline dehydrogenase-like flavoprotein